MKLNLHSLAFPVRALGPGLRAVLWVAGCGHECPGCISPEMQPRDSGRFIAHEVLAKRLLDIDIQLTGLTVSGGEPVDQADALCDLLKTLTRSKPDWDVILYSGYTKDEIAGRPGGGRLLGLVDVLIDGLYRQDHPSLHPLTGSGNQVIHYLSPRGQRLRQAIEAYPPGRFDLGLGPRGMTMLVGVGKGTSRSKAHDWLGCD